MTVSIIHVTMFVCLWFLVRSVLSIVPQSAELFEGSLRENIDPVGEFSDADIWMVLDQVSFFLICEVDFIYFL